MSESAPHPDARDLPSLLASLVDGSLEAADRAELARRLESDPDARRTYIHYLDLHCEIADSLSASAAASRPRPAAAPAAVNPRFSIPRLKLAAAAILLLAAAAVAIYVFAFNSKPGTRNSKPDALPIATVIDTTGNLVVRDAILSPGDFIRTGDVSLDTGSAEFRLDNGVAVTLRGDTRLTVHSSMSATLAHGSAAFDCPPAAKGYTVHLPGHARVVDLGTEFETTAIDGRLTVRVLGGTVDVISGAADAPAARYRLQSGQRLALVDGAPPESATLDLADVVGGGDGWGGGAPAGVRLVDGRPTTAHREEVNAVPPANTFIAAEHALIDGVFVPDGNDGSTAIPVSSTGLTVTGLADGDGRSWDEPWNGLNARTATAHRFDSVIGMHASKGVTFDLDAIRHANPGLRVERFTATAAMGDQLGSVMVYVAIDGVVKLAKPLDRPNAAEPIDLPLDADARFLTLIAVSNGVDSSDWAMFGDAKLTLTRTPDDNDR